MKEKDLNIKYICDKTSLSENDELIPIILDMIQESYKAGLCQAEYDNTMELMEENQELKKQLEEINYTIIPNCDIKPLIDKFRTQQKEFIKYLEDEFTKIQNDIEKEIDNNVKYFKVERRQIITEILQKYKEIIGGNKDE